MKEIPWYKKWIGYIIPIVVAYHKTDKHPNLKIKYYQGQWQLESSDALYSDGHRYTPFRLAFDELQKHEQLFPIKHFLLLGAGLGSALHRIQKVYNQFPASTLVEYDKAIIELGKLYFDLNRNNNVKFIHQEANSFIEGYNETFDLIGIDLFKCLENSELLNDPIFWNSVCRVCDRDANIIVNTIFLKNTELKKFEELLETNFTFERLERKPNYIFILNKK